MKLIDGIPLTEEQAIDQYQRAVYKMAQRYYRMTPARYELDDLIQQGFIGLIEAYRQYKPDTGAKFITYAMIKMRKQMQLYLHTGSALYYPARTVEVAMTIRSRDLREVDNHIIAKQLNVLLSTVEGAKEYLSTYNSTSDIIHNKDAVTGHTPEYWVEYHDLFKRLTDKQCEILLLILQGHTRESMKEVLGVRSINDHSVRVRARKLWTQLYGERGEVI